MAWTCMKTWLVRVFSVLDGPGERGICCDKVVDGGVLLDGRVGKVVN